MTPLRPSPARARRAVRRRRPATALALRGALVAGALVALATALAAPPAGAHGDDGIITVEAVEPGATEGALALDITASIAYESDLHAATPASFDATATSEGGAQVGPVPLEATEEEGRYRVLLEVPEPGTWSVHLESTDPAAVSDQTVVVEDPAASPAPGAPDGTASDGTAADGSEAPGVTAGDDVATEPVVAESSGDGPPAYLVVGLVVLALLAAGGIVALLRSRRRAASG